MKRFLLFALAAVMFAACAEDALTEQSGIQPIVDEAPETLTVGFEGDDETRIQLNEQTKTVWTNDDLVSVFYKSDANQKWQYQGVTGECVGTLKRVDAGAATARMDRVVVAYPYSDDYLINLTTGDIEATLPATQTYLKDSYGLDGNIMVSSDYFTQISLKNVCGWLKLQLTGDGEKVKSITFKGNSGEQVAGLIYINTSDATAILASEMGGSNDSEIGGVGGSLVFDDTILTEVTLNCGDGVTLSSEATAFYIALPPQTFSNGFTVEIEAADGHIMSMSTGKTLTIERNHIQPMTAIDFTPSYPLSNEIFYTATEKVEPNNLEAFGTTFVSSTWDAETGFGVMVFDGSVTKLGNEAFSWRSALTSVIIPEGVTTIGDRAFVQCSNLPRIVIPDNVTTIGNNAFAGCVAMQNITLGNSVVKIGYTAFQDCKNVVDIMIPNSVEVIGQGVFWGCNKLSKFNGKYTSDNGLCVVADSVFIAFAIGSSITEYCIPENVIEIGSYAFDSSNSLTSVTIHKDVKTIKHNAFASCSKLTNIYCKSTTPPTGTDSMFWGNVEGRKIYVPIGSVDAYKSASGWSEYVDCIVGYNF